MLHWAVVFFVVAILSALFGFGGIAAGKAGFAKVLVVGFSILTVVSLIADFGRSA